MIKLLQIIALTFCVLGAALADRLTIKDDAPSQYIVKKGDTLWDISALYLNSPWRWPELWGQNPQIDNPHLIYPGDILRLVYDADGNPRLFIANSGKDIIKVSPSKRTTIKRYQPVATLPLSVITPYLSYERILVGEEFDRAPMLIGGDTNSKRKVSGDLVYVQGTMDKDQMYGVYSIKRQYEVDEQAYYELNLAGTARVVNLAKDEDNKPLHSVKILTSRFDIAQGFRLVPLLTDKSLPANYTLTQPREGIQANVIGSSLDISEFGKLDVIVLDAGKSQGLETGNVLSIYAKSPTVMLQKGTPVYEEDASQFTKIINFFKSAVTFEGQQEDVGKVVVFKVYDDVSYALITEAKRAVRKHDSVGMPRT
ncbi:LysM domain-containing protein [Saccharobesus litoralis]|uniref:LysM domain-containing protein n=1 Tax=Saccharobesus litoralis TaxID=2172099 RepID=A0A2S0VQI4_9ALTE|nr:LysM domain-containing protein [Saccharobesus litoralis]AWB66454.1 LysM domain-containing protein [Saccharobesus litoralis]